MFLAASIVVFAVYFANVTMGAFGTGVFMSDIQEMLVLFAASILFVVAILIREADRKKRAANDKTDQ